MPKHLLAYRQRLSVHRLRLFILALAVQHSSMIGMMLRGRPTPLEGAFVVPKQRRLERMCRIERSLQPATSAI
jgi:hypothetical protein